MDKVFYQNLKPRNLYPKMKKRHEQKLIILSLLLLLCFNMPLLLIFDSSASLVGIPVVYVYFFSLWIFSILISLLVIKRYYE